MDGGHENPEMYAVLLEFKCNIYRNSVYTAIRYIVGLFTMFYVRITLCCYYNV